MLLTDVADSFTKFNELLGKYVAHYNTVAHPPNTEICGLL